MMRRSRESGEGAAVHGESGGLNVVNLIDILIIIVIFLLKSFSAQTESKIVMSDKLRLPVSKSDKSIVEAGSLIITKDSIQFEGKFVAEIKDWNVVGLPSTEILIPQLKAVLDKEMERIEKILAFNPNADFKPTLNIIADKDMPFSFLKKVLYTVGQSGFSDMKFVSQKFE